MFYINCLSLLFLKHAHWSDMFTGRLKSEIPKALASRIVLILVFMLNFLFFYFFFGWGHININYNLKKAYRIHCTHGIVLICYSKIHTIIDLDFTISNFH